MAACVDIRPDGQIGLGRMLVVHTGHHWHRLDDSAGRGSGRACRPRRPASGSLFRVDRQYAHTCTQLQSNRFSCLFWILARAVARPSGGYEQLSPVPRATMQACSVRSCTGGGCWLPTCRRQFAPASASGSRPAPPGVACSSLPPTVPQA